MKNKKVEKTLVDLHKGTTDVIVLKGIKEVNTYIESLEKENEQLLERVKRLESIVYK